MQVFSIIHNACEYTIRGQIDLSAGAAVTANRGDDQTVSKTATGTYTVTVKGVKAIRLVEVLDQRVNFANGVPVTALGCRISSVTQTAGTDDLVIVIKTSATGGGADTDVTGATTLSYEVTLRNCKMGAPL